MMNKYENAIDIVARYCSDARSGVIPRMILTNELDILMELVERSKPKKVKNMMNHLIPETYDYDYTSGKCPMCGINLYCDENYQDKYCPNCGQAIDWSGD